MDLQMEPVDGIESTRQIRARYDDVEVVVLTSYAEDERVHAALEAGASGYLLKDADADEVAAAVRAAHRGELQLDPAVARRLMSSLGAASRADGQGAELTARELEVAAARRRRAGANKEIAAELGDQRADGPDARVQHPGQAGPQLAHAGRAVGRARGPRGRGRRMMSSRAAAPDFTRFGRCCADVARSQSSGTPC